GNGKNIADPSEMNFNASEQYKKDYSVVGEYRGKTTPVRQFAPNALGFFDLSGNVEEWCYDWFGDYPSFEKASADIPAEPQPNPMGSEQGSVRVHRGGSWLLAALLCRAAYRFHWPPDYRNDYLGFRLALSLQ
ncbi:MAG: formylglycine-generating enzyme family protein, partial [Saprospiraceae bacterium]